MPLQRWFLVFASVVWFAPITFGQRDLTDIPIPDPEVEKATFQVDEGWTVELFAGDPAMAKPIHMNWDNQRRLWIASSETYPQIKPGEPSNDKILIVEDIDADGRADRTVVFADGLLIPTGVLPANDGDFASAYVANSDQLLYLKDTDGDLVADEREVVLSGFGTEDTHHLLHSLRWGHDGWIYMNQSIYIHSHIETPWGVQRLNGGGIWRFHPATKRLEVVARGFVNPWGVHFDRYGQMFATDGAYGDGINYAFPGSVFVTAVGAKRLVAGLNPGSPKHCSLEILSGTHWPESIRGSMVTNDFRAHRVCRFKVSEDKSGYESIQQPELIKTPHVAFRPIDAKQGLDGALYIADWYNPIIQHGEVDFRDPRRDRTHGRIWRLTHRDQSATDNADITTADPIEKNFERLADDADLVRLFAGQAIRRQVGQSTTAAEKLDAFVSKVAADPQRGLEQLELLWVLEGMGRFDGRLQSALAESPDGRLRAALAHHYANQIRWVRDEQYGSLEESQTGQWVAIGQRFANDPHPRARLEGVRMLAELPSTASAAAACDALQHPMDRFLDFALWQTLRDLSPVWLPEFRNGQFRFGGNPGAIAFALQAIEDPSTLDAVLTMLEEPVETIDPTRGLAAKRVLARLVADLGNGPQHTQLVEALVGTNLPIAKLSEVERGELLQRVIDVSMRRKQTLTLNKITEQRLKELATQVVKLDSIAITSDLSPTDLGLVALRGLGALRISGARASLEDWAAQSSAATPVRQAAIGALASYADESARGLLEKLGQDQNINVASAALAAQSELDLNAATRTLVDRLANDAAQAEPLVNLAGNWMGRKEGSNALTAALQSKSLEPSVARLLKASVRKMNAAADLLAAIDAAGKLEENRWVWNDALRDRWLELARTQGDAERGEWIYRRAELQCIQCHRIGGAGGVVGPDLTSIGAQAPADYLVEALIYPAAKVKEGYNAKLVRTEDDEVLAGIPIRESDDEVVLRLADGREVTIAKSEIVDIKESRSLMPDGLLDSLSENDAIDLLRFVTELGKLDGTMLVPADGAIRSWEALTWTEKAFAVFNRTSLDSIAADQSPFAWQPLAALVSGSVPMQSLAKYRPHADTPDHTFLRTKIVVTRPGEIVLRLTGAPKGALSMWANGNPVPITGDDVRVKVVEGEQWWFLGVNRNIVADGAIEVRVDANASTGKLAP